MNISFPREIWFCPACASYSTENGASYPVCRAPEVIDLTRVRIAGFRGLLQPESKNISSRRIPGSFSKEKHPAACEYRTKFPIKRRFFTDNELQLSISDDISLDTHIRSALRKSGILTLQDLLQTPHSTLLNIRGIGISSLEEIIKYLNKKFK